MAKVRIIGTYQPECTPLHGVDARAKIIALLLTGIALIAVHSWAGFAVCALFAAGALLLAHVRPLQLVAAGAPCAVLAAALMVLCALIPPSWAGIAHGASIAVRIIIFTMLVLVICATTTPTQLVDAYGQLLSPISRLGVAVERAAFALAWLTRLVPLATDEMDHAGRVCASRGARQTAAVAAVLERVRAQRSDGWQSMVRRGYAEAPKRGMRSGDWLAIVAGIALIALAVIL